MRKKKKEEEKNKRKKKERIERKKNERRQRKRKKVLKETAGIQQPSVGGKEQLWHVGILRHQQVGGEGLGGSGGAEGCRSCRCVWGGLPPSGSGSGEGGDF